MGIALQVPGAKLVSEKNTGWRDLAAKIRPVGATLADSVRVESLKKSLIQARRTPAPSSSRYLAVEDAPDVWNKMVLGLEMQERSVLSNFLGMAIGDIISDDPKTVEDLRRFSRGEGKSVPAAKKGTKNFLRGTFL